MPDADSRKLDPVIDELYGLPVERFVAERNARAKGSPDAAAIRALTKPSAAAWALNLLARGGGDELGALLDLGDRMRAAGPSELRSLDRERRDRVAISVRAAAELAEEAGHPVSDSVRRDLEATFQAAVADADAAAAVASGRLVRTLEPGGFDAVDLDGAIAGNAPKPRATARRADPEPEAEKRALEAAQREAEAAADELGAAVERRDGARTGLETVRAEVERVEQQLQTLREEAGRLEKELTDAERAARDAEQRARRARQALDRFG